ncbi:aminotransferase class V-fold PLP-dependent enzyme [Propionibacteriaceae bacterium Y2011]
MAAENPWRDLFTPSGTYLNTASVGLPSRQTADVVRSHVEQWAAGELDLMAYHDTMDEARERYARLTGLPVDSVHLGSQTSVLVGQVAASLPDGADVVLAEGDYASLSFPLLAQQPRISVRVVPLTGLADAVGERTTLVAASTVQSADGTVLDLAAVQQAAARVGAELLVDATQSAGWLPLDLSAVGYTTCSAYKWLMAPRGAAFGSVRADLVEGLTPVNANMAGADPASGLYGSVFTPRGNAHRFDVSPAWPAWAGAVTSLDLLTRIGVPAIHAHDTALAARCAEQLGVASHDSAIIAVQVASDPLATLAAAGVTAVQRAGRLRLAFHLYNTEADVDRVVELIKPFLP